MDLIEAGRLARQRLLEANRLASDERLDIGRRLQEARSGMFDATSLLIEALPAGQVGGVNG